MALLSGLNAIEFRCPSCKGERWATMDGGTIGRCLECPFRWGRKHDFRVFVRKADGSAFETAHDFERELGFPLCINRIVTVAETLHELLEEVMTRPPTVAVIETWTLEERRTALAWAAREVMAGEPGALPAAPRPTFIEPGAGTA